MKIAIAVINIITDTAAIIFISALLMKITGNYDDLVKILKKGSRT